MVYLSKFSFLIVQPLTWVIVLLALALVISMTRPRPSIVRNVLALVLTLLLLIGWLPLSNAALRGLEDQYQAPSGDLSKFTGMIVLGGVFGGDDGRGHGQIALAGSAERVVVPLPLMKQYPHMRMLFTGGNAALVPTAQPEAATAQRFFDRMGADSSRIIYESESRNTFENSEMSARLPDIDTKAPWLLVTSASHMPRAMATFAHSGWNVTAYPVDYMSAMDVSLLSYSLVGGAYAWQVALREWVGLMVYRATGKVR